MTEHTPTPWTYRDVSGAGLEISAPVYLQKGVELPRGMPDTPIKIFEFTAPQIVPVAAERWVQFEPKGWSEMQEANAAFIVKAVNNHDALVKALEAAREWILKNTSDEKDHGDGIMYERGWWDRDTDLMNEIEAVLGLVGQQG